MKKINFTSPLLSISLHSGINVYERKSAIGKSFIPMLAKQYSDAPMFISFSTKEEYKQFIANGIDNDLNNTIYFLDRFDLFKNDQIIDILKTVNNAIVLIDLKDRCYLDSHCIDSDTIAIDYENGGYHIKYASFD